MKKLILMLAMVLPVAGYAQQSELQQIQTTIGWYFEGWGISDSTLVGKAMHPTCHLKFFRDGKFTDMTKAEYLSRFKLRPKPDSLFTRIVAIDITENIASAKTEIEIGNSVFTDYFNLMKIEERWFIVDKIAVRKSK
jgi:aldose sugar dehydrogenase